MGADSCASDENCSYVISQNTKIFQKDEMFIGCANSFRIINIIEHCFTPSVIPSKMTAGKYIVSSFVPELRQTLEDQKIDVSSEDMGLNLLVGIQNCIFEIQNDFSVITMPAYGASIGSGSDVARGSLFTSWNMPMTGSERVLKALEAAEASIATVRRPFNILEVK